MGIVNGFDFDLAWYCFYMTYLAGFLLAAFILTILPDNGRKFSVQETLGMAAMWWMIVIWIIVALVMVVPRMQFGSRPKRPKKSSGAFFR